MDEYASMEEMTQLVVRVTPNARKSELAGWGMDEKGRSVLLMKLGAPPVDGKANAELVAFLAKTLGCAKSEVTLVRGEGSRQKTVELPLRAYERLPVK